MNRLMKICLVNFSFLFLLPNLATANWQAQTGKITELVCHDSRFCFLITRTGDAHRFSKGGCKTNKLFFDISTPGGKALLTLANSAILSRSQVQVHAFKDQCMSAGVKLHRIRIINP